MTISHNRRRQAADGAGMKRNVMVGGLVGAVVFAFAGSASALERLEDGTSKYHVVSVFSEDPMGGGEPAAVQSPAPAKDVPAAPPAPKTLKPVAPTGFVFTVGGGARALGGDLAKTASVGAGFVDVEVKAGYFVTQHIGLFAGIDAGAGEFFHGCDSCSASRFSLPVSVQVALDNRANGPYLDAGFAFLSSYKADADDDSGSVKVRSTADLRFGLGARKQLSTLGEGIASSLDVHFGVDLGKFDSMTASSGATSASADIPDAAQSWHYAFTADIDWHFAL